MAVSALVMEYGGNEDQAIAALLHDAIEDGPKYHPGGALALRAEIREQFGAGVLDIVESCTDADAIPKPPWRERKEQYLAHLAEASDAARLVACADKLHNARCILADYRQVAEDLWGRVSAKTRAGGTGNCGTTAG
jgi:GTP pyrophosphokinase